MGSWWQLFQTERAHTHSQGGLIFLEGKGRILPRNIYCTTSFPIPSVSFATNSSVQTLSLAYRENKQYLRESQGIHLIPNLYILVKAIKINPKPEMRENVVWGKHLKSFT